MNTRDQGAIGVAKAIAYYGERGAAVFVPVADTRRYDLVVDFGDGKLVRVEVKTTAAESGRVMLRTCGGNQSWNKVSKTISASDCDKVLCFNLRTGAVREYDAIEVAGKTRVVLR